MTEKNEITPDELNDVVGGKQTRQASAPEETEGKQTRPTRGGKLTFRQHNEPGS